MDLSYSQLEKLKPEAERLNVSERARSPGQFVSQYKRTKRLTTLPEEWKLKRQNFIKRQYAQYKTNPTYRRYLALAMWAWVPPGPKPSDNSSRKSGKNSAKRGSKRKSSSRRTTPKTKRRTSSTKKHSSTKRNSSTRRKTTPKKSVK